jgi:uncharacterized protein (TIGR02118 family)
MLKAIFLIRKKETLSNEEFSKYWLQVHNSLVAKIPGLKKYVANIITGSLSSGKEYDGVAEFWFEDRNAMEKGLASPEGQLAWRDGDNFVSMGTVLFADEYGIL